MMLVFFIAVISIEVLLLVGLVVAWFWLHKLEFMYTSLEAAHTVLSGRIQKRVSQSSRVVSSVASFVGLFTQKLPLPVRLGIQLFRWVLRR